MKKYLKWDTDKLELVEVETLPTGMIEVNIEGFGLWKISSEDYALYQESLIDKIQVRISELKSLLNAGDIVRNKYQRLSFLANNSVEVAGLMSHADYLSFEILQESYRTEINELEIL